MELCCNMWFVKFYTYNILSLLNSIVFFYWSECKTVVPHYSIFLKAIQSITKNKYIYIICRNTMKVLKNNHEMVSIFTFCVEI